VGKRRRRSLIPREHGAYGQLAFPLVAALGSGRPTVTAGLYAAAAVLAFLAHEPALILLGRRGPRVRNDHRGRAWLRLVVWAGGAAAAGVAAIARQPETLEAAAAPAAGAALLAVLVAIDVEKTTFGETVAATALAAASLPVARASGVPWPAALGGLAAWSLGFAAVIAPVRWVIARHKSQPPPPARLTALGATLALAVLGAQWRNEAWAGLLLAATGWILAFAPPHPRELRRIGWALIGASVATAAALIAFARL